VPRFGLGSKQQLGTHSGSALSTRAAACWACDRGDCRLRLPLPIREILLAQHAIHRCTADPQFGGDSRGPDARTPEPDDLRRSGLDSPRQRRKRSEHPFGTERGVWRQRHQWPTGSATPRSNPGQQRCLWMVKDCARWGLSLVGNLSRSKLAELNSVLAQQIRLMRDMLLVLRRLAPVECDDVLQVAEVRTSSRTALVHQLGQLPNDEGSPSQWLWPPGKHGAALDGVPVGRRYGGIPFRGWIDLKRRGFGDFGTLIAVQDGRDLHAILTGLGHSGRAAASPRHPADPTAD